MDHKKNIISYRILLCNYNTAQLFFSKLGNYHLQLFVEY
jgi:hypothetical protein